MSPVSVLTTFELQSRIDSAEGRPSLYRYFSSFTGRKRKGQNIESELSSNEQRRRFRIPGKVLERNHFIHDELTSLTKTFNEMTDELELQYLTLEDRVVERTQELNEQKKFADEQRQLAEEQKKLAEEANEAKSLFIANISHELRRVHHPMREQRLSFLGPFLFKKVLLSF